MKTLWTNLSLLYKKIFFKVLLQLFKKINTLKVLKSIHLYLDM